MYGFLKKYPNIKLVEDKDTAETAHNPRKSNQRIAAIASETAAEMYNLEIIAPSIQTIENNMTSICDTSKREFFCFRRRNQ